MKYIDERDRLIFVSSGLGGDKFMTMYQNKNNWNKGGMHRLKSKKLSLRDTKAQAQIDLDNYAKEKNWKIKEE